MTLSIPVCVYGESIHEVLVLPHRFSSQESSYCTVITFILMYVYDYICMSASMYVSMHACMYVCTYVCNSV